MKHIKLYIIALAIACSMLMVCPFAYANEYLQSDYDLLVDYVNEYFPECSQYCPASSEVAGWLFYQTNGFTIIDIVPISNLGINSTDEGNQSNFWYGGVGIGSYWGGSDWNQLAYLYSPSTISVSPTVYAYRFVRGNSTIACIRYKITNSSPSQWGQFGMKWYGKVNKNTTAQGRELLYNFSFSYTSTFPYTNGYSGFLSNQVTNYLSTGDIYLNYSIVPRNIPSYVNDERLKLYKLWSSQNGNSLVVDLSEFRTYTAAAAYNFSNIVLTLTCNGVDTEYTLPLTSSTINNGWDNSSNLYTISTPLSDFTLSDTYDTYITKVSFNLDYSSPGGTGSTPFYISTNFSLDVHHSIITPDIIPMPATVYDDPAKPIDISDRQYDLFQQLQSNVAGGDIVYVNNYPVLPSWANVYNLNTFFYDNKPDELNIYHGAQITGTYFIDSKYDFDIKSFLYDNANSAYYDVVIIRIDNTVWPSVVNNNTIPDSQQLYGYVVLYTSTYYMRLDAETQINILESIQLDAKQSLENWNWLVEKMDDFENKSLEILNPLFDETTYIDDKLASILYAVNNIESYNDSSIVTLLTDIKGLLSNPENEIDTPQECIQLYEAHPDYFNELWGNPTPALRSASVTPSPNNPYISSDYVRADLIPAWWEGKTLTMVYILKNDGDTSRFYDSILGGLFDAYENLIESDSSFTNYIDSLFKTGYDYTDSFYGHLFDLNYDPEEWEGGFGTSE